MVFLRIFVFSSKPLYTGQTHGRARHVMWPTRLEMGKRENCHVFDFTLPSELLLERYEKYLLKKGLS